MNAKQKIKIIYSFDDKILSKIFPYLLDEIKCDITNGFGKCQKKNGTSIEYSYLNLKKIPIEYENIIKLDEHSYSNDHSIYLISMRYIIQIIEWYR